jgi:hypothetical protein
MISGPRCKAAPSSDRHVQPRLRVVGEHNRVQRGRDVAGERRVVRLSIVRHVVRVTRGLCILLSCGPVDRRHGQVHHMQARIAGRIRVDSTDRHREHESIADARVLAIADDRGAVVEEHAEQRDRLGKRRRRTGEPRRCSQRYAGSTVHGGLQSNLPYEASQARPCLHTVAPQERRCVENLLRDSEFPVEYSTTKIFFLLDSARIVAE